MTLLCLFAPDRLPAIWLGKVGMGKLFIVVLLMVGEKLDIRKVGTARWFSN
jgi:hypothetical protein